jgi:hypothetical protein
VDVDRDHDAWVAVLVQELEDGTPLDLAPGEDVDVSQAPGWPASRRLPGEALRAALLTSDVRPDPRGLRIRAAYITAITDLADLRVPYGLHFDSCAFEESADWSRMTVANLRLIRCMAPGLTLDEAHIAGGLNLEGTTLTNKGGVALSLDRAEIKGSAFLNPVTVTGVVRALGATIGGELNLEGATLTNKGGDALYLDGAEIKGDVFLNTVTVTGVVRAVGATIGGELHLEGATLTNKKKDGYALYLDDAEIKGSAFLNPVTVTGVVRAQGATVGGVFALQGAVLTNEGGDALALQFARLNYVTLVPAAVKGSIALGWAQITVLTTPEKMSGMNVLVGTELSASGWRLGDVEGRIRHDKKAAADWLSRDNAKEFVAQPWHELANVYERNGQPADARWMRWKAARGITRTSPWSSKLIRKIYGALTGHGYYPLIAAVWLILAIVASGIIVAANAGVFTPTATNKAALKTPPPAGEPAPPITGATPCELLQDRSSCLKPGLYAFDNTLPGTLATGQAAQWTANGAQGWNAWIPYTLGGLKIASWILVALLLAGVTGLLRKT